MDEFEVIIKLVISVLLGGIVGFERERAHKMAGIRTHALVSMGAAILTIVSVEGFLNLKAFDIYGSYDPGRIISYIVVGIGFIGGGAILRKQDHVVGVTTAATLWFVAIIGILVGMGLFYIALSSTVISYLLLTMVWVFERKIQSSQHFADTIEDIEKGEHHVENVHSEDKYEFNGKVDETKKEQEKYYF